MSTHTPGPWRTHNHHVDAGKFRFLQTCMEGACEQEWQANARLIAAAPELLEALSVLLLATMNDGVFSSKREVTYVNKVREQARAAIAKARGKL